MSQIYYKVLHINPLPKVSPPKEIQSDFRPISRNLVKVMEGFARSRLVSNTRQARPVPVCEGGSLYIGHFYLSSPRDSWGNGQGGLWCKNILCRFFKMLRHDWSQFFRIQQLFLEYNLELYYNPVIQFFFYCNEVNKRSLLFIYLLRTKWRILETTLYV